MAIYSAIPVLIVPLYSRLMLVGDRLAIDRGLSAAFFFFCTLSLAVSSAVFFLSHPLTELFASGASESVKYSAGNYLSIMALTFVLSTLVSLLNAVQTVNKVVIPSYIVPIGNNLVFCTGLYLFSTPEQFESVLLLGVLAWLLLVLINGYIARKSITLLPGVGFDFFKDKEFIFLFLPAVMSFYVEQLNGFVGVYFAAELGVGAISVFGYSTKLNLIFLSVFLVFLTASLFPRIAAVAARNDSAELARYLTVCIRVVVLCSVPIAIYMIFYSEEIVTLLFKRGKFLSEDVSRVALVLSVMLLALPFCLLRDIMNRVFFSHGNTLTPVLLSLFALLVNAVIACLFYQRNGLVLLAVAAVVSTILNCLVGIFLVQRKTGFSLFFPMGHIVGLCGVAGGLSYCSLRWLDGILADYWLPLFVPFFLVYLGCLLLLRVKEAWGVAGVLRRRAS